jgi:hypothetical protein
MLETSARMSNAFLREFLASSGKKAKKQKSKKAKKKGRESLH